MLYIQHEKISHYILVVEVLIIAIYTNTWQIQSVCLTEAPLMSHLH